MSALYLRTSSITRPPHSASHSLALLLSHSQFCSLCSLRVFSLRRRLFGGLFRRLFQTLSESPCRSLAGIHARKKAFVRPCACCQVVSFHIFLSFPSFLLLFFSIFL